MFKCFLNVSGAAGFVIAISFGLHSIFNAFVGRMGHELAARAASPDGKYQAVHLSKKFEWEWLSHCENKIYLHRSTTQLDALQANMIVFSSPCTVTGTESIAFDWVNERHLQVHIAFDDASSGMREMFFSPARGIDDVEIEYAIH